MSSAIRSAVVPIEKGLAVSRRARLRRRMCRSVGHHIAQEVGAGKYSSCSARPSLTGTSSARRVTRSTPAWARVVRIMALLIEPTKMLQGPLGVRGSYARHELPLERWTDGECAGTQQLDEPVELDQVVLDRAWQ